MVATITPVYESFSVTQAQVLDGTKSFRQAALEAMASAVGEDLDLYGVRNATITPDSDSVTNTGNNRDLSRWYWLNGADLAVESGYMSLPLIKKITRRDFDSVVAAAGVAEVQHVSFGGATGGSGKLTFDGAQTAAIAFGANAAAVTAALEALVTIAPGDVAVVGAAGEFDVTFAGTLANEDVPSMSLDVSLLTGRTGPGGVTTTTAGSPAHGQIFEMDLWHEDDANTAPLPVLVTMPAKDKGKLVGTAYVGLYSVQFGLLGFDGPAFHEVVACHYNGRAQFSNIDELGNAFSDGKARVGRLLFIQPV